MKKYSQSLKETAYHEAGHLVTDIILELNPNNASVVSNETREGVVTIDSWIEDFNPYPYPRNKNEVKKVKELRKMGLVSTMDNPAKIRKAARKVIISCLAGYEAAIKFDQKADYLSAYGDLEKVIYILDIAGYYSKELDDKSYYYPVLAKFHKKAKDLVEKHWFDIEKIAHLLMKKKELNEDDIKKLSREILSAIE